MFENVLKSGKIGNVELKNRFVMPSMGSGQTSSCGEVTDQTIAYYTARARGGFGLIITEFTGVDISGLCGHSQFKIYSDNFIPGFVKLVNAIHENGAKTFMQLHHAGRVGSSNVTGQQLISSSTIALPIIGTTVREMTTEEVYDMIEKFGDAALRAKKIGYDGVELHGGHGYLIAQFLSGYLNRRVDEFGGDITGRAAFAVGIIRNIKKKCGDDFPVIMRIAGDERINGGMKLNETKIIVKMLENAGVDAIHVTAGLPFARDDKGYSMASYRHATGINTDLSVEIKKVVKIPVIVVGRIVDPTMAEAIIEDGMADFIALGRASIADPEFPKKVMEGRINEISPCTGCMSTCITGPDTPGTTCAFNPFSGNETTLKIDSAMNSKKVVVVGGGVGGLEAAWIAACRGHKVILLEKEARLGGQVRAASMPYPKQRFAAVVKYYITMCKKYDVDIRLNTNVTTELIVSVDPDVVILATGATPIKLEIPNDGVRVEQAIDILNGVVLPGRNVLVVGGGLVGIETAEFLMIQRCSATVVEMTDTAGEDMVDKEATFKELYDGGIKILTSTKVKRLTVDGAVCVTPQGEITLDGYDMVVMAVGSRANNPFEKELREKISDVYVIGDAKAARRIKDAVREAAEVAIKI